jgi:hypothetical protein
MAIDIRNSAEVAGRRVRKSSRTDYRVISADSHVVEPPDLWANYLEPKYRDRGPRIVHNEDGDSFEMDGSSLGPSGFKHIGGAEVPAEELAMAGRFDTDVPKAAWDPHERVKHIEQDGLAGEVIYPSLGIGLHHAPDLELRNACFRAYNNWVTDFCSVNPRAYEGGGKY